MPSQSGNTLSKAERLSSKRDISRLLNNGRWGSCNGIKYCYFKDNGTQTNRIMVAVPKKYFKRAVKRNLLKRRIREAYRTQKGLVEISGVDLMIQYDSPVIMEFTVIYGIVGKVLSSIK